MKSNEGALLDRVRLELNPCRKNLMQESMFVICSFDMDAERCLEVTVRKALQVEYLVQHVSQKYGGHIIPVLELYNFFTTQRDSESKMYIKIAQYLNDLIKNPHCKRDPKLYQFIFQQEVHFPHLQRYDKVLSDAAMLSRKYLNTIFTRKQYGEVQVEDKDMIDIVGEFKLFSTSFRAVREIVVISGKQQELLENIFEGFREIRGGLGKAVPPVEFMTNKMEVKLVKIEKLIFQAQQAYNRWQVLRETVRELHCNINKGLHQQHTYYMQKLTQLKTWTKSLMGDLRALIDKGNEVITQYSKYIYSCKKQQSEWFCINEPEEQQKVQVKQNVLDLKQWDPLEQEEHKKDKWVQRKLSE